MLRIVVGGLLLVFGLQWIRKAVLRASGRKALHDEAAIYEREVDKARAATIERSGLLGDPYAFTLAFKGVLLEGLEVVFIVLTFGTNAKAVGLASIAAGAAAIVVILIAVVVRGPLARVPENTLKFVVGIMLTAFGLFWAAEGAGAEWPGADISLLVIAPVVAVISLLIVAVLRSRPRPQQVSTPAPTLVPVGAAVGGAGAEATPESAMASTAPVAARKPGRIRAFGLFWWDFIVGDDWVITAIVVLGLGATAAVALSVAQLAWILMSAVVLVAMLIGIARAARS
ncbi:hypothetical protein [Pseudolysinimonas kribbensis]|uniref:hypothetical protein n=1 Tax=Pseudolysinimonas kribbensis TaxID=433641 RepID=UPI003D67AB16